MSSETIPEIPKPTLHQVVLGTSFLSITPVYSLGCQCQKQFIHKHLSSLMVGTWYVQGSSEFQSGHGQLLSRSHLGMKALNSGHHVVSGTHGWSDGQVETTKPRAIFKIVSVRLKLFPLRQNCGVVWMEPAAGSLSFSVFLSVWLSVCLCPAGW